MRDLVGINIVKGIGVGMDKETPNLNDMAVSDMQSLYKELRGTVDIETAKTTASVMATNIVNNYSTTNNSNAEESNGSIKDKVIIHNVTKLDGRVIAEATAPYVDTELGYMQSVKERGGC